MFNDQVNRDLSCSLSLSLPGHVGGYARQSKRLAIRDPINGLLFGSTKTVVSSGLFIEPERIIGN